MIEIIEYQNARIKALEAELKRLNELLNATAKEIEIIILDPNFDKPLSNLNKNY
jgi:phosphoribosylaminoimidazole-succinocarboxamide synthase